MPRGALKAVIFDLDGVITGTARIHAAAWKDTFDRLLASLGERAVRIDRSPFDLTREYRMLVDGRPRLDGVRAFLVARRISLPEGTPADAPFTPTVHGIGNAKNERFRELLRGGAVEVYDDAPTLLRRWRARGLATAVVSASRNCVPVLASVGALDLFDTKVDGDDAARLSLPGKPAPDTFLYAAQALSVPASRAMVVEDALAGVEAGRAGGFGRVIGVARNGDERGLLAHGADRVIRSLAELDDELEPDVIDDEHEQPRSAPQGGGAAPS